MKKKISIAIPEPLDESLRELAKTEGLSLSAFISHLLMNAIKLYKKEAR